MTFVLANCFDGISNGTGITTGNSGAASGAAFDVVTIGTGATITGDTSIAAHPFGPASSAKFVTGGTAAQAFINYGTSFPSVATSYFRVYGYFTANPASNVSVVQFRSGTSGVNLAGAFVVNTTGTVSFIDSASVVQLTSAHTIPLGAWWRLEGYITGSASTGKAEFKCYFTSPDGSTADETKTSAATLNTSGSIVGVRMGIPDALANITLRLDDVLVTDIGYMGPSVASPSCRVGASVFDPAYGSSQTTKNANWDAVVGRDMASGPNGVMRRYYQEGELPATSGADSQNVVADTQAGTKCVVSFHPWRDSTNAYSGTITGKGITYAQELTNLQTTLLMYLSNGVQPSQLEFALWHEENGNGYHGPFGDCTQYKGGNPPNGAYSATTNTQAESNYASYFAFYAPVFSALGLKLTYIPAVFSPSVVQGFFPGNVTASLAAYHNAVMTDYYWLDYNNSPSTKTLANSVSLATTYKLKLGIGEWGFTDGTTVPNASQFTSWCTGVTTPPGEILAPLLAFKANGGTVGDVIWFAGSGGANSLTSSTDPSIIASVQEVYDKLTTTPPPLNPSALFPAIPGDAIPAAMSPGDPGSLSPSPSPPAPGALVNHWIGDIINAPGQCQVTLGGANASSNALVCFVGWNDYTFPETGIVSVADDAHNYWQPLSVNTQTTTDLRGAIWIATAAAPCQVVCISSSLPVSSMVAEVCELAGLPQLADLDLATSSMAVNNTAGFTGTLNADWAFSLLVSGNNTDTITPSGGFTALPTVTVNDPAGAGGPADITLTPMYLQTAGGSATVSYSSSGTQPLAHTLAAIFQASNSVSNAGNVNWPVFQVLAAFGAQVGTGTTNFTWTDITSRAIFDDSTILDAQKGRSYELAGPEAGTLQIWLNNQDGALTPGNASSPYYPNILPQTPVKVIATWNNVIYNVAFGYMDKWPQSFNTPQWGFVNSQASDAMGVLANLSMFSALQSEVLFDNPYAYWPLNDSYGDANGLPFTNLGQGISNTKPMVGLDGQSSGSSPLSTGLALNLQGDTGTGIGLSGLTSNPAFYSSGALCDDPGLPQFGPGSSISFAAEFWASMPTSAPSGGGSAFETPLVALHGPSTNFGSGGGATRLRIVAQTVTSTTYSIKVTLSDAVTNSIASGLVFALPNDGNTHHHFFNITNVSGAWSISHYLDGVFDHTYTSSGTLHMTSDIYLAVIGPCQITPFTQNPYNYTIGHVALYTNALNPQRILAHYQAGAQGFQNDTDNNRFARIMAWSNTHVPNAALGFAPSPLMGPAFSLGSQAPTDAINDLIVSTGGFPYADGSGTVWWVPRTALYNRVPKWVLSDNPADSGIFYDPGQAFDFDNSYLFIQNTVGRVINQTSQVTTSKLNGVNSQSFQNTGAIVTLTAPGAQAKYGNRNALAQTILTSSDQDVYDRNNWSLAKYSSSSLRVPRILVDAASNPAQWPFVLGAEQGDIVQVKRSPLGGAPYVMTGIIVSTHLTIGMNVGQIELGIVPYNLEANILQVGINGSDTLDNGIGW